MKPETIKEGVNRQEQLQPCETAREVYLGPRTRAWARATARARAIEGMIKKIFSRKHLVRLLQLIHSIFASNCISRLESFLPIDPKEVSVCTCKISVVVNFLCQLGY